jgi:hypothetical protein
MLEQQRIEYLQAMGIQLWMPRHALDNAAEPSWLAGSEVSNSPVEVIGGVPVQAGHAADLLASMGLGNAENSVAKTQITEVIPSALEHKTAQVKAVQIRTAAINESESETLAEMEVPLADLTIPKFELHFALWPCGILWVAGQPFEQKDHSFQTAVSYSLLGNTAPQASYSQFKWPYIEGSNEDQTLAVALRALTAQWEFMSSQGARGWVAMDSSSLQWLEKVAVKALFSVDERSEMFSVVGKKQLWLALQSLSKKSVS